MVVEGVVMFSYEDLYNKVFDTSIDADRLVIISGYVGPAVVQDLKKLPYNVELYVGMYGNVISGILHKSLLKSDKMDNVSIFYTNTCAELDPPLSKHQPASFFFA